MTKPFLLVAAFITLILLTGCWNRRELNELSIVTAIAVDQDEKKNEYEVSLQIINPGQVASSSGKKGGGSGAPIAVYSTRGRTLDEAIRRSALKVPRVIFFAHTRLIVIDETTAKQGIKHLFDVMERDNEVRTNFPVFVARKTSAKSIISTITPLEKIPANDIRDTLQNTEKTWGENFSISISDIIRGLVSDNGEPIISGIRIAGDKKTGVTLSNTEEAKPKATLELAGIALFKDGKLIHWLDGRKARGLAWVLDKVKTTILVIDCNDKKNAISIEVLRANAKIEAQLQGGKPKIVVHVKEEGNIDEVECDLDVIQPGVINQLQRETERRIRQEVMDSIRTAQEYESDVFGFGEAFHRTYPAAWKSMKKNWDKTFSDLDVEVNVTSYIRRTGLRTRPAPSK
ncbi:Ger(x)C family spore germination protein [Aneurinibacillus tyrosinisolvens]|uniref:Ger(x)C family spore germination protein n=1 Tax=Aneurinibacillus tyrosinisolvens TaxID=1443435 RepID=UPI00063EF5A5|nr:Ger(x)C family spore germination protein [Aneurinibacillus tyrosinisolvens]